MKKLATAVATLTLLAISSVAFAASGIFEFTYANNNGINKNCTSEKIVCLDQKIEGKNGTFDGVIIDARPKKYVNHEWIITTYLNGYKGVGTYSVKGGSQFKNSIMHFSGGGKRYFSAESNPGKVVIISDDGNTIKGEFKVTAYHAGEVNDNPQVFKGTFTVSRK